MHFSHFINVQNKHLVQPQEGHDTTLHMSPVHIGLRTHLSEENRKTHQLKAATIPR